MLCPVPEGSIQKGSALLPLHWVVIQVWKIALQISGFHNIIAGLPLWNNAFFHHSITVGGSEEWWE